MSPHTNHGLAMSHHLNRRLYCLLGCTLLLTACTTSTPNLPPVLDREGPPPIERDTQQSNPEIGRETQNSNAATNALLAAATNASQNNDHNNAIVHLERAIRIDPRNAALWLRLSAAHLANHDLAAANQHARKAIALAGSKTGSNSELTRSAWFQMADIKEAEGKRAEADSIRRRYRRYRG